MSATERIESSQLLADGIANAGWWISMGLFFGLAMHGCLSN